jgi:hypothetical protein
VERSGCLKNYHLSKHGCFGRQDFHFSPPVISTPSTYFHLPYTNYNILFTVYNLPYTLYRIPHVNMQLQPFIERFSCSTHTSSLQNRKVPITLMFYMKSLPFCSSPCLVTGKFGVRHSSQTFLAVPSQTSINYKRCEFNNYWFFTRVD